MQELALRPSQPDWHSYGLVSLWDMLDVYASTFIDAASALSGLIIRAEQKSPADRKKPLKIGNERSLVISILSDFHSTCEALGARVTAATVEEIASGIRRGKITWVKVEEHIKSLGAGLHVELGAVKLFALHPDEQRFYADALQMFGTKATTAFPSTIPEIDEAGKCLALGRTTAAIFHLMRIVEVALRSLRGPLGITEPNPSWNTVIRKLDKELKLDPRQRTLKADVPFLEGVSAQMHAVNRAWRTRAMHVDMSFSLENARDIFSATKSLMQHLATQLSESSPSGERLS